MKPVIMVAQRIGGENGGPFVSHKRIMESRLKEKYEFVPLMVPRARVLLLPWNMYAFVKKIKRCKPALVQIAGLQLEGFLPMLACKLAGVKTVLAIHGSMLEAETVKGLKKSIYSLLEQWTVRWADGVFGVSDYVSSWPICRNAQHYYGTIYNLISTSPYKTCSKLRSALGIPSEAIVVVSTGRIIVEKGYADLWQVIQKLDAIENVHYVIAGDGAYLQSFRSDVTEREFNDRVHLLGYVENIDAVLDIADVFIICTHHETLCISILEACKHSLPIVATNVGGIPEIVDDGVNGYLVENGDISGFANALHELINSCEKRKVMGSASYEKLLNKFDINGILNRLDSVYSELREG